MIISLSEIGTPLNSDDLYNNRFVIQKVMEEFMVYPSIDIVYGDLVYVKSENLDKIVRKWISKPYHNKYFEYGNVPAHPSLFVKREVYSKAGVFSLDFNLAADYEFMLRIFKKNNFKSKYINSVFVKMRLGGATNQSFSNIIKQNIEIFNAWKCNGLNMPYLLMLLRFFKRLKQFV